MRFKRKHGKNARVDLSPEELKELKRLEKEDQEGKSKLDDN